MDELRLPELMHDAQNAVDTIADGDVVLAGLDVDVGGAHRVRVLDELVHEADNGRRLLGDGLADVDLLFREVVRRLGLSRRGSAAGGACDVLDAVVEEGENLLRLRDGEFRRLAAVHPPQHLKQLPIEGIADDE